MIRHLKRFFAKFDYLSFFVRVLVVFVMFGGIYSAYYLLVKKDSGEKESVSAANLQVNLKQHVLALSGLSGIDIYDISTPYKIEGVRSNIDITRDKYKNDVAEFQKQAGFLPAANPESFFEAEQKLLSQYDQNYTELKNLVQYSVSSDLGSLPVESELNEIANRSSQAIEAITRLAQSKVLSSTTIKNINKSLICIKEVNSKATNNDRGNLEKLINECDKLYSEAKPQVIKDIISPLNSVECNQLIKSISVLSGQIADKPKVSF